MGELGERRWSLCCRTYTPLPLLFSPLTHPSFAPCLHSLPTSLPTLSLFLFCHASFPHSLTPSLTLSASLILSLHPYPLYLFISLTPLLIQSSIALSLSLLFSNPLSPFCPPIIHFFSLFSSLSLFTHPIPGRERGRESSCCQATRLTNEVWRREGGVKRRRIVGEEMKHWEGGREGRKERRKGGKDKRQGRG